MKIALVGHGKIGRLHAQTLTALGHKMCIVDPYKPHSFWPSYSQIGKIPLPALLEMELWIIASPTEHHFPALEEILALQPHGYILIEKPAVLPHQLHSLSRLQERFPMARIAVQDTYGLSPVTDFLLMTLRSLEPGARLTELAIEMSKNRLRDEANGRFIDQHWGVAGYEGFHLLSLKARLTNELGVPPSPVRLITSCDGSMSLKPKLLLDAFSMEAQKILQQGDIAYGHEFRFRIIQGRLSSGLSFELAFEPRFNLRSMDYKNFHCLAWEKAGKPGRQWFFCNHFETALLRKIQLLQSGPLQISKPMLHQHNLLSTIEVVECPSRQKEIL